MRRNPSSFPPAQPRNLRRFTERSHDVLIIGGGINGAGIARDLAMRGLRVALVEKGDFASGASSASTKLIHGGVRYLERLAFRLVFEACRERRILQSIAPHLVRPIPFFIPVFKGDPRSLAAIRTGMSLYDLLAMFRNTHSHKILSAEEALRHEPALRQEGLSGVALYWDCRMDDARLCLENILAARELGADIANYLEVTGLIKSAGRVRGARVLDRESGQELEVTAEVVINTTGPWLDRLCSLDGEVTKKLRPTRGTHILVPRINRGEEALYLTAGRDERLFFVIPWGELSLVGTTDADDRGDPDLVAPTEADIEYLLAETAGHLRGRVPNRADVVAAFAGLRPLVAESSAAASSISREHRLFESASGLLSVGGGKYTTYRAVAAEVAERITERLGRGRGRSLTHRIPLPGGATGNFASYLHREVRSLSAEYGLAPAVLAGLLSLYGSRTARLLALLREEPALARPVVEDSPLLAVQVAYATDFEMARTPEDVLRRRTPLALQKGRGLREVEAVAALMSQRLQLSDEWRRHGRDDYLRRHSNP
ncbi:MAG TPA: glycerol-3-phosphate dehydrogenase [Desulfuromonadales bacterium]|nr:glycerol-3-phosphate dehydrogenase [Desulfuromonadales bacterium]